MPTKKECQPFIGFLAWSSKGLKLKSQFLDLELEKCIYIYSVRFLLQMIFTRYIYIWMIYDIWTKSWDALNLSIIEGCRSKNTFVPVMKMLLEEYHVKIYFYFVNLVIPRLLETISYKNTNCTDVLTFSQRFFFQRCATTARQRCGLYHPRDGGESDFLWLDTWNIAAIVSFFGGENFEVWSLTCLRINSARWFTTWTNLRHMTFQIWTLQLVWCLNPVWCCYSW